MAGLVTLEVLGESPMAEAIRATQLEVTEPLIWICEPTPERMPLDAIDAPDVQSVIVSSSVPVGTIAKLEALFPTKRFAYVVENVRRATAVADFQDADHFVIGTRDEAFYRVIADMLRPICPFLKWVTPESAELSKLALNAFLSLNIAFMHEIEDLCHATGATAEEVSRALMSDRRISPNAPLKPGPSWGGDHLARDVKTLHRLSDTLGVPLPLIRQLRSEA